MNVRYKDIFTPIRGIANFLILPNGITITKIQLNTLLFSNIGDRYINSLVFYYLTENDKKYIITDEKLEELTNILNEWYNQKWQKVFDALTYNYNVGENYKRQETENITLEGNESIVGSENTKNQIYGFDSENPVDDKNDLITSNNTNQNTSDKERNLIVTGNMGGSSYQSLIREELKLRENIFLNTVFTDIKKFLVLPIY